MCGIAGVVQFDDRGGVDAALLGRMAAAIAHRGPDGTRLWVGRSGPAAAGLAFCRLAIIDPDPRSMQPMSTPDGRYTLVFNGEIYNYRALRSDLPDVQWQTSGDGEVLLHAWARWGSDCLHRLDGMFALAIWDAQTAALHLARDPAGQKPMYVAARHGAVAFVSEISALRTLPWFDDAVDDEALRAYLRLGFVPRDLCIYRCVRKLPPGCCASFDAKISAMEARPYGTAVAAAAAVNDADLGAHTRQLVQQAVTRQLVADVPVACLLSGGIDSSCIAAAMKAAAGNVLTFSIGFEDRRYDETPFATAVARHLGTKHETFFVRPDAAADLPLLAAVFGEPFADSSALPTHYLARQVRPHVKVALGGDGGDELFGGYDRYRALMLAERFDRLPSPARAMLAGRIWQHLPGRHPKSRLARIKRLLRVFASPRDRRYMEMMQLFSAAEADALMGQSGRDVAVDLLHLDPARDVVAAAAANDLALYLPDDVHTKVDRAAMLCALEVRAPFMDADLRRFAGSLSGAQLLRSGRKHLLRRAFEVDLPGWVFTRRKMGFAVPIGRWLRTTLRPMLMELVLASDSLAAARFAREPLMRLLREHDRGSADHGARLYAVLMLELWWRWNRSGASDKSPAR